MSKRVSEAVAPTVTPNAGGESAPLVFKEGSGDLAPRGNGPAVLPVDKAARAALVASKIDEAGAEVIRWGNGEVAGGDEDTTPAAKPAKPAAEPKPKDEPAAPAEEAPAEEETAEPVAAKPTTGADKRRQILESLDKEKTRVDIENRIKEEQTKREAAEAKLAEFEKSPLGRKLATIAKQHGMSLDDLKDKLLIGADDVLDKPDAVPAKVEKDPEVAALLEWKAKREKQEDDAKIQQSVDRVREQLKDTDLPMVDAFDAHGRVLVKAHAGWVAGGKKGTVAEYIPSAADIVEDELKAERPNAAKRLYAQAATEETTEAEAEPIARPAPRPAMGKRQAARPGTKPAPLPMDPEERDRAIKAKYGWA